MWETSGWRGTGTGAWANRTECIRSKLKIECTSGGGPSGWTEEVLPDLGRNLEVRDMVYTIETYTVPLTGRDPESECPEESLSLVRRQGVDLSYRRNTNNSDPPFVHL